MMPMQFKEMDFKDFDDIVKTYYPLNKEKTRYLIRFINGDFEFYFYNKLKCEFKKDVRGCLKW